MTNTLTVAAQEFSNTLIFLLQKRALQKLLTFFQRKISMYLPYFKVEILAPHLANNFVKFLNNLALVMYMAC